MKIITFSDILDMNITAKQCIRWAKYVILHKNQYQLPPKISIKFHNHCFFNTMPSLLQDSHYFGVKVVSRITNRKPSIKADILLYSTSGNLLALIDGTWITMMRTGAIAAITIRTLKKSNANQISFIGLGNTAKATLLCYNEINKGKKLHINLFAYKNQHLDFIKYFKNYKNITFRIYDDIRDLASISDVFISCVTHTQKDFVSEKYFKKGTLIIPIHTMGFQNCDMAFDKIFCDDLGHISHFKYFHQYKFIAEMSDIFHKKRNGRDNDKQRIIAYNIGISIQDIYFAMQIYKKFLKNKLAIK